MERLTEKYREKYLADVYDNENDDGGLGHAIPLDDVKVELLIQKLGKYEDLEEQGLLKIFPCKVGDTVYEVQEIRHRIQPLEIISVYIGRMGEPYFYWELKDDIGIYQNVKGFGISQLGKTVFLTQAEAEEALKRLEVVE